MNTNGSAPADVHATPRATKFSLAANYDPELVPALAPYPVDEVYGKFPTDGVSGGRPRYLATPLSEADLRSYIRLLDRHGIAFNYLLNGACFGNREWTRPWQKRVTALLTKLGELGVRRVTVSTPFLLELVKRRFPELRVRVGIYAQVDTPRRARFWEELVERQARGWVAGCNAAQGVVFGGTRLDQIVGSSQFTGVADVYKLLSNPS